MAAAAAMAAPVGVKNEGPDSLESAKVDQKPKVEAEQQLIVKMEVDVALEQAAMDVTVEEFKRVAHDYCAALLTKWHGPRGWLNHQFPKGSSEAESFMQEVLQKFPKSGAILFAEKLPDNVDDVFFLHLADLSWFPDSSTKPAPYLHTSLLLLDEILTHTFVTRGVTQ